MSFRILGLSPAPFSHLFGLDDASLALHGASRCVADRPAAFPDRVELRDAAPGESVILVNYTHQPGDTPYRASHAIFVLEGAQRPYDRIGEVPEVMRRRTLSLRAFDARHMMVDADLCDGREAETLIERFLADPTVDYIQAHYARRGCYAARIERA
jgi:Protein of unknown function (DUF1203)